MPEPSSEDPQIRDSICARLASCSVETLPEVEERDRQHERAECSFAVGNVRFFTSQRPVTDNRDGCNGSRLCENSFRSPRRIANRRIRCDKSPEIAST
jgi:hypothetical protein